MSYLGQRTFDLGMSGKQEVAVCRYDPGLEATEVVACCLECTVEGVRFHMVHGLLVHQSHELDEFGREVPHFVPILNLQFKINVSRVATFLPT